MDRGEIGRAVDHLEKAIELAPDVADAYTNVHSRAGAGRTSRMLVPNPPEWRWMAAGEESPWFPGCRIYRQEVNGDWEGAFQALTKDLYRAVGGGG